MVHIRRSSVLGGLVGCVIALGLVLGGVAVAQSVVGTEFTGCLRNGTIKRVALGSEPLAACKSNETQVNWNSEGPTGADGATWYSGANLPNSSLGEDGDLYLLLGDDGAATVGDMFVKQSGTWTTAATIQGPEGPEGPQGPPGVPGPSGGGALAGYTVVEYTNLPDLTISNGFTGLDGTLRAECPAGTRALGGGYQRPYIVDPHNLGTINSPGEFVVFEDRPSTLQPGDPATAWVVTIRINNVVLPPDASWGFLIYAQCAQV